MNVPESRAQMKAGLALTLLASTIGCFGPCICEGQAADAAQATVTAWVPTGNLNVPRAYHTATLLLDGKVLVVGGRCCDDNASSSAELYDPADGTWRFTGRPNANHYGHTATLLPDGRVLVVGAVAAGGYQIASPDDAELYDPGTGMWRRTTSPRSDRFDHTATLLQAGKVLIVGGGSEGWGTAELFDSADGTWSWDGGLLPRAEHRATLLLDGRVLVTGGSGDADLSFGLPNAEFYDPIAGTWSHAMDLHVPRYGHSATLLADGRVLVAGGDSLRAEDFWRNPAEPLHWPPNNSAEVFDPALGTWSSVGGLNTGRSGHTATLLPNGEVLVAGGYTFTPPNSGVITKRSERYDASGAAWLPAGDLNVARSAHTATLLPNGKVLVVGGYGDGGYGADGILNSAELYGPVPPGTIVPAFTGSWFDPAQNGQGLLVEVLPNNQFLAAWFAFNPAGSAQAWFTGVGTYSGNTATIANVIQPSGGHWIPNFDPNRIVDNAWGSLKLTFTDCNHGKVEFASSSGYGTGSMNLTRLTQPAGLTCS